MVNNSISSKYGKKFGIAVYFSVIKRKEQPLADIYAKIYVNSTTSKRNYMTGMQTKREDWKRGKSIHKEDSEMINYTLLRIKNKIISAYHLLDDDIQIKMNADEFLHMYINKTDVYTLDYMFDLYLNHKKISVTRNSYYTIRSYMSTCRKMIENYSSIQNLSDVTHAKLLVMGQCALNEKYASSTVKTTISYILRAFKHLVSEKNLKYNAVFPEFRLTKKTKKNKVILKKGMIKCIVENVQSKPITKQAKALTWFCFMLHTGMNFNELQNDFKISENLLLKENSTFDVDIFNYTRGKTKNVCRPSVQDAITPNYVLF